MERTVAKIHRCSSIMFAFLGMAFVTGMERSAAASTLCVDPKGIHGCY
jgi:hypothetical protein